MRWDTTRGTGCPCVPGAVISAGLAAFLILAAWPAIVPAEPKEKIVISHRVDLGVEGVRLHTPAAAAFGSDGRIFVLDGEQDFVKVYAVSGKFLFSFGRNAGPEGPMKNPLGLRISLDGEVFVTDSGNRRVVVFGPGGDFRHAFALRPDRYQFPADPTDIALDDEHKKCFIVDNNNHRIITCGTDGKSSGEWGQVGVERGEFRYPFRIARDKAGDLFVTDVINTRVQIFAGDGTYRGSIGEWGVNLGQFFRPSGIAVDARGRIYVSDGYLGVVQVFHRSGEVLGLLVKGDGERAVFKSPISLAFSAENLLAVTESLANRVSIYAVEK